MKREIIIINQSTGYLMIDVVNAYAEKYESVVLMTGSINQLERPLHKKVKISKIISYNKKNATLRLFTWIWGTLQVFFKMLLSYKSYEVLYVTNPPMSYFLALVFKRPFSILVYDTYPDALKNTGIHETNFIYKWWSNINKKIFPKAEKIFTLSQGMAANLSNYVSKERIKIIPNWSGSDNLKPILKNENHFLKEHNLTDKFIVLYSGNMGYTHSVDVMVEVAEELRNDDHIYFLFIGEGKKKGELINTVKAKKLKNCLFMTWQAPEILPYSLASADLGVVTLNEETALLSVPSKTYNLLAVGAALLSIAPESSELAQLIKEKENGASFKSSEIEKIAGFISYCANNPTELKKMSVNSIEAGKEYTYRNAEKYVE